MEIKQIPGVTSKKSPFSRLTIVVIDKTNAMLNAAASILNTIGFGKVYQASNGADALKYLNRFKVDLILSECAIGQMDGIELLRRVREMPQTANIPFVLATATVDHHQVVAAIKSGVSEYIVKPYSPKILTERLTKALANPVRQPVSHRATKKQDVIKEKLQLLIVDDAPDSIQLISELLKDDYKIKATTEPKKALKICAGDNPPDIVLLDIIMPELNGLEVCQQLKANPTTEHITVIFLTSVNQTEKIIKGFELGAVDYITKPINPPIVKARVNTHAKVVEGQKLLRSQVDTMIENERLKMEFDRVMQNDLKQPIKEVEKSIEKMEYFSRDPNKVKAHCQAVHSSCHQLSQIINNMLLLTKLEAGDYLVVPIKININKIIERVINTFSTSIRERRLEMANLLDVGCFSYGEELLTESLFSNLIKNAIEAAPAGSAITITNEGNGSFQIIKIHNQGAVPIEIVDHFFDKYVTAEKKGGSGIGTYAAKLFTEIQSGELSFTTSSQEGTRLSVSLPKNPTNGNQ